MAITIYKLGDKVPFYKPYDGRMNAIFASDCFVDEQNDKFVVVGMDEDKPFIKSDILYRSIKPVVFMSDKTYRMEIRE